jgi:hypothetical protein
MQFQKINSKQQALNIFEATRKEFLEDARIKARMIFEEKGQVTTDDIRQVVKLPAGIDARVLGAIFVKRDWKKIGYTQTNVKSSHSRPISIFVLNS